jgi:hypothetical protein
MKNLLAIFALLVPIALQATEQTGPQVEMVVASVVPCVDVTGPKPMPATCTYFTLDGERFSASYSRDDGTLISTIHYPTEGEPRPVSKEDIQAIILQNQMAGAI